MRRLTLLAVLAVGLAACGGSGASKDVKITFGRSGGTMIPYSITIAPGGAVTRQGVDPGAAGGSVARTEAAKLSQMVRDDFSDLKSAQCPGTFPDESAMFISALGKTVTVRGACEPGFTKLWNALSDAAYPVP